MVTLKFGKGEKLKEVETEEFNLFKSLVEWGKSLVMAVILACLVWMFIGFFAVVPTGSMIPTIHEGERIIVWRCLRYLDWENRGLTYGDMVVFWYEDEQVDKKMLVKRVIGMGGDTISIDNGVVYRNGEPLDEPYVVHKDSFFMQEITIPENEIFVLGDNRAGSYDSRYWKKQTLSVENVVGEVTFLIPSLKK